MQITITPGIHTIFLFKEGRNWFCHKYSNPDIWGFGASPHCALFTMLENFPKSICTEDAESYYDKSLLATALLTNDAVALIELGIHDATRIMTTVIDRVVWIKNPMLYSTFAQEYVHEAEKIAEEIKPHIWWDRD